MHDGSFKKTVTVTSNAKNKPTLRLTIGGTFRKLLEIEPSVLRFNAPKDGDSTAFFTITTPHKKFAVTSVHFKENERSASWLSTISIPFTLAKDTTAYEKKKGANEESVRYILRLRYVPVQKADKYGKFIIKTNIPEKPELSISGILEAFRE